MVSDAETGFHSFFALFEAWQDIFAINLMENGYFKIPILCSKGIKQHIMGLKRNEVE